MMIMVLMIVMMIIHILLGSACVCVCHEKSSLPTSELSEVSVRLGRLWPSDNDDDDDGTSILGGGLQSSG